MGRLTTALGAGGDLLLAALKLQLIWVLGALAGGVVLGWAPATMAAVDAAARTERGEPATLRHAVTVWRSTFWRSQITLGIPALLLLLGVAVLGAADAPPAVRVPAGIATALLLAALAYIPSLELRDEIPAASVLGRTTLLALAQLPTTLLLGAVLVLWAGVALSVPGLVPFLGVGVPLLILQHLVGRSLDRNERLLDAEQEHPAEPPPGHPAAPATLTRRPTARSTPAPRSAPSPIS